MKTLNYFGHETDVIRKYNIIGGRCHNSSVAATFGFFFAAKFTFTAAHTDLQPHRCTLQRQLYFCRNSRQFCSDKIKFLAIKRPHVFAAAKFVANRHVALEPKVCSFAVSLSRQTPMRSTFVTAKVILSLQTVFRAFICKRVIVTAKCPFTAANLCLQLEMFTLQRQKLRFTSANV